MTEITEQQVQQSPDILSQDYFNLKNIDLKSLTSEQLISLYHSCDLVKTQYKNLQLVVKCNANSLYGVSASPYFSLFDVDIAEDITTTAKHFAIVVDLAINDFFVNWGDAELRILQEFSDKVVSIRKFTEYKADTIHDVCVYGDTDSRYIDVEQICNLITWQYDDGPRTMEVPEDDKELINFVNFIVDRFINKVIKESLDAECDYRNARKGYLRMAHEVTGRKSVFLKKKKYVLTKIWEDGKTLNEPKIKYQGVEIKKGSQSGKSKKILKRLLENYLLRDYNVEQLRKDVINIIKVIKAKKDKEYVYLVSRVSYTNSDLHVVETTVDKTELIDCQIEDTFDNIFVEKSETTETTNTGKRITSDKNHIQMQILLSWTNFINEKNLTQIYRPAFNGQKMNYYYTVDKKYPVIGVPDDIDMNDVKGLPEPDWNKMLTAVLIKPLLRYILEQEEISDRDCELFLLGAQQFKV